MCARESPLCFFSAASMDLSNAGKTSGLPKASE